jgi:two-component system cell cycle sensor histidine kinase/response regulator CckA
MIKPLRVLIIEDSEDDAQLLVRDIERAGYEVAWTRVETSDAMVAALRAQKWDVALSDHGMPHFSGPAALGLLQATGLDIPFVIVSGKIGEEKAVEMMRAGASDYVSKDNLARLVPAIERELRDAEERRKRRRAEEAQALMTRERNALLTQLQLQIERMPLGYLLLDADCRLIDWNPAAERIFGYKKEEILGMGPPFEKIVPLARRKTAEEYRQRLLSGDMHSHDVDTCLTKDGKTITCEWFNTPIILENGRFGGIFCLVQDVTERKTLEEQYRQAQKMEALGQLAGGVAHDFNNLLTIINGCTELLLSKLGPDDSSRSFLEQIKKAGERSAVLTRQLLTFSRKQAPMLRVLDLNAVIADVDNLLRRLIGENIKLVTDLSVRLRNVQADPGQMEQVLCNLIVNARDAMPQGGQITIRTRNMTFEKGYSRPLPEIPLGSYVLLQVEDTGTGMTPEVLSHLFEPFFTTKEPGKGTGLGLATVFGIVKQFGGYIAVESQPGSGSMFRIYLPEAAGAAGSAITPQEEHVTTTSRGGEVVLLVEDEGAVRMVANQVLIRNGYTVLEATNGQEALKLASQYTFPIHMLITDVVMPEMGGFALARKLQEMHPEAKVLFVSGYPSLPDVKRDSLLSGEFHFMPKPFSPMDLARKVRGILDGVPQSTRTESAQAGIADASLRPKAGRRSGDRPIRPESDEPKK